MGGTLPPIMLATAAALDRLTPPPGAVGAGRFGMLGAEREGPERSDDDEVVLPPPPGRLGRGGGARGLGDEGLELGLLKNKTKYHMN